MEGRTAIDRGWIVRQYEESPSPAERAALRAVAKHGTIPRAAEALSRSRHTVDAQLDNLRDKTNLRYLPQLIAFAARAGWLEEEENGIKSEPDATART